MSAIEDLRELEGYSGSYPYFNEIPEPIQELLDEVYPCVDRKLQDGGRWTNVEITVHKVEEDGETAYFKVNREVPATEMQEGGEFSISLYEVKPVQVTVIKYV